VKILLLIRALDVGGTETQIAHLARGLSQKGLKVAVAVFYVGGRIEKELREDGIEIINLKKSGRWDIFLFGLRLRKLVKKYEPDIIYGFLTESNLCALLCKVFSRHLVVAWGIRTSINDAKIRKADFFVLIEFIIARHLSRFADLIIANSESSKSFHENIGFKSPQFYVIENGIDTDKYRKAR